MAPDLQLIPFHLADLVSLFDQAALGLPTFPSHPCIQMVLGILGHLSIVVLNNEKVSYLIYQQFLSGSAMEYLGFYRWKTHPPLHSYYIILYFWL